MIKQVEDFIDKHELIRDGSTILVGVSGGPDSMALLHMLNRMKQSRGYRIIALSVDHSLRGEQSKEDVLYVENICRSWGIECQTTTVDVPAYKKQEQKGTQVAARELRYQFFENKMVEYQADYLALAHHGDDQAETMLMRFVRGTNPDAIKGIPIKRKMKQGFLVRPFLCITKQMIVEYCKENAIEPRIDPSNEEDTYTRNFYRMHVLPLLYKQNPNLNQSLQRLSETIAHDDAYLKQETEIMVNKIVTKDRNSNQIRFSIQEFLQYPYALQRRAFHLILNYLYNPIPKNLHYDHEDQFFNILHSKRANAVIDLPVGLKMVKTYDAFLFTYQSLTSSGFKKYVDVPGSIKLPDGSVITTSITNQPQRNSKFVMSFPVDEINYPSLIVRTRKAGDKIQLKGLNGSKKVKDIFIDEKIPLHDRDTWPIVTDLQGNIIWLVGLKKGKVELTSSNKYLELTYMNDTGNSRRKRHE